MKKYRLPRSLSGIFILLDLQKTHTGALVAEIQTVDLHCVLPLNTMQKNGVYILPKCLELETIDCPNLQCFF